MRTRELKISRTRELEIGFGIKGELESLRTKGLEDGLTEELEN